MAFTFMRKWLYTTYNGLVKPFYSEFEIPIINSSSTTALFVCRFSHARLSIHCAISGLIEMLMALFLRFGFVAATPDPHAHGYCLMNWRCDVGSSSCQISKVRPQSHRNLNRSIRSISNGVVRRSDHCAESRVHVPVFEPSSGFHFIKPPIVHITILHDRTMQNLNKRTTFVCTGGKLKDLWSELVHFPYVYSGNK